MRRRTKILIGIMLLLFVSVAGMIVFSPYGKKEGYDYKLVRWTLDINAPSDSVFKYLGNSANAHYWSVYVDHITALNNDSFLDGAVGARRRCFQNPDEKGTRWDELITVVEPGKRRQLTIYDMQDFPISAEGLATEQVYAQTANGKCRLTFLVFFLDHHPSMMEEFKMYFAAYTMKNVFEKNMANIKRLTEEKYAAGN